MYKKFPVIQYIIVNVDVYPWLKQTKSCRKLQKLFEHLMKMLDCAVWKGRYFGGGGKKGHFFIFT